MLISFLLSTVVFCQDVHNGEHRFAGLSSTGYSGTAANINVIYHKIYWRINPDSTKYIKGYVQTNFITTVNNVASISFDMNAVLQIDSVIFRNAKLPAGNIVRSGNIVNFILGTTLPLSTKDSLTIFYQGAPPAPSGQATGYVKVASASAGNYITTLSESYEDRDWWPCKADMQDKIDSIDFEINVPWNGPDTFWVACNGKLIDSTINGVNRTFKYSTRYPITTYLVFVSVAKFNRYYTGPVTVNGTQIPTAYYLLQGKTPTNYSNILVAMDKINPVLQAFSERFGDYPFELEKHGFYDGLSGAAGMEHQTFSGMNSGALTSIRTLTHELMHQWFGNNVTFSTWNDLWLAEGFARYSECLVAELFPAYGINPFTTRNNFKNAALSSTVSAWIPNANIVNSNTIWGSGYGSSVYERGAMIVSMLRAMCGDTKFYQILKNYQTGMSGKSANADSLKNYFNALAGQDLTPFFNDYVGGSGNAAASVGGIGNPSYVINWSNPSGNRINVSVGSQLSSAGSNVTYFRGPVVLRIRGLNALEDTSITFVDWGSGNLSKAGNGIAAPVGGNNLTYDLSFVPQTVLFDDSSKTLATGTTNKLTLVPLQIIRFNASRQTNGNQVELLLDGDRVNKVELWKSTDGINFVAAGEMNRNLQNENQFSFTDINPGRINFYKGKIFNQGRELFTGIVKVTSAIRGSLTIAPNPAKNRITIRFDNALSVPTTLKIMDANGRRVYEISTTGKEWNTTVRGLAPGMYILQQIVNNSVVNSEKLMVQ